jgi:O-antigen/teichoic acid export membrane protein
MKQLRADTLFDSAHLQDHLARRSISGGASIMAAQGLQFALMLAGTAVLARVLSPSDYGMVAMCSATLGFVAMFKDAGLSMATIQKGQISSEQISSLFWINLTISWVLGLGVLLVAPLVAAFYGKPELTQVTAALSLSFVIGGLTLQHQALLRRHMMFESLIFIQIVSYCINLGTTVVLAVSGWRYWSLVAGTLAQSAASTLLEFVFCPWVPGRPVWGVGARKMIMFGGHLTGFSFLNYCARNLDNVLIGRFSGAAALGEYARAYQLLTLPVQQINGPLTAVAVPALSRLQSDPERYRKFYLRAISLLAFVTIPGVMFLIVMSREVIILILGPQWVGVADIYVLLGISAILQPVCNTTGWLFVSQGRSRELLTWGAIGSSITVGSILIGMPWGPKGVALSYSCFSWASTPLLCWFVFRVGPIRFRDVGRVLLPPLVAASCACTALLCLRMFVQLSNAYVAIVFGFLVVSTLYIAVLMLLADGRAQLGQCLELVKSVARSDRFPRPPTTPVSVDK